MKIKKYRVFSMQEGLAQIRKELGSEAVIVESRKRRQRGFKGWFLPRVVEITAAVDKMEEKKEYPYRDFMLENKRVDDELNQLKSMMSKILTNQEMNVTEGNMLFNYWSKRLTHNDVDPELAAEILADIKSAAEGKEVSADVMETLVQKRLKEGLLTQATPVQAKFISFVGPTGVGKTTTLAKLAASYSFEQDKKVAIITIDTYRIGAVEQLKAYAGITGIPIEVVFTIEEMEKACTTFQDYDVVLVDTAGRSSKNAMQIAETTQYIKFLPQGAVFLVMSATTKSKDLKRIISGFKRCNYNSMIFTKLDETDSYGIFLNACRLTSLPIAYVTTGQNVPEDIEPARASKLADMVLGED